MCGLIFVGVGLGSKGVSLEGLDAIRTADVTYVEYYTTPHEPTLLSELERAASTTVHVVDRGFVEDGEAILAEALSKRVVLAVPGDPMIATTHTELRTRAIARGIKTRVVHAATIGAAAASESGLHFYKFARTVTIPRDSEGKLSQQYKVIHDNLLQGAHTLLLLEHDTESGEGVSPSVAAERLLSAEASLKREAIGDGTFVLVLSRLGRPDQRLWGGTLGVMKGEDFGAPPHCVVVPGSLHFTEVEAVAAVFSVSKGSVRANSDGVKRTAQVLIPRYVAKTRKALGSVRGTLGKEYDSVIENAELYMADAERFLANDEDELAMLSIGYAEGLIDSLSFAGVAKIDW